jgi:RimJ/RimL family protein N-acetyltransferase
MAEVIAETERLILRTWRPEDRAVYIATCNTEAVTAHLDGPASPEDIDAGFARIAKSQSAMASASGQSNAKRTAHCSATAA